MWFRVLVGVVVVFFITNVYFLIVIDGLKEENNSLIATKKALEDELYSVNKKYQHKISLSDSKNKELLKELQKKRLSSVKKDINLKELASSYNVPSMLIPESINSMTDEELKENLVRFLKLKDSDLPSNMGLREFINNLIKIAVVDDLSSDENIHIPDEQKKFKVVVPLPKDPQKLNEMLSNNLDDNQNKNIELESTKKITATLDLKDVSTDRVLVKLVNKDNGKVVSYKYMDVKPNDVNAISFDQKNNWKEGSYEVKVFTTQNEITQIARAGFTVK